MHGLEASIRRKVISRSEDSNCDDVDNRKVCWRCCERRVSNNRARRARPLSAARGGRAARGAALRRTVLTALVSAPAPPLRSSTMASGMMVTKRDGSLKPVSFDKITQRIAKLCYDLNPEYIDPVKIAQKVIAGVFNGVTTEQLDRLAAETGTSPRAAPLAPRCPQFLRRAPAPSARSPRSLRLPPRRNHTPPQPRTRRRATRTSTRSRRASRSRTSRSRPSRRSQRTCR